MNLADLRLVEWELAPTPGATSPEPQLRRELVPAGEVDLLVEAVERLHRDPGLNPHSGRPAARLLRLAVGTPRLHPGYWWTAPSLDEAGPRARVVAWDMETRYDAREADERPDPV